ncbi:MAG: triphosphoribosyl-dephospho-CoA synthase CitG [Ruminococcaceae bacterium]|nr:triphosphoribosyl-dephospho-CoA synthase CitG [Oscillospiraceae bacterium]
MEVSLIDILNAREARAELQQQLLKDFGCPVISFTMNIAGPIKNTPLIERGFQFGLQALQSRLPSESIKKIHIDLASTGCTALLAVDMDAFSLKQICVHLEDASPIGRLFDMDVLDKSGDKLERKHQRGCLVCGAPGRVCAAGRLHSVSQLQGITNQILEEHFAKEDRQHIAALAVQSLIDEVNTTPKPGLVDRRNNGSHQDMTLDHFLASAEALRPYFKECVKIGQETANLSPTHTFPSLRIAGIEAEKNMYQATGGVNTHKGIIYTMGILCGSIGRLWHAVCPIASTDSLLRECAKIVSESAVSDLTNATGTTAGELCYLQYGVGGIRQEVASGLPSVSEIALPCYEKALADGASKNDAGAITLIHLIAKVADTNLYHRGGKDGAEWASKAASALLPSPTLSAISDLDDAFIGKNLSPGGCADLLAVTYFLHSLQ